jgi:hypothetical protein
MAAEQIAKGLASLGRGKDTMLMHVTPNEVAGLQGLAMAQGGSLTINPQTGLPEAGFFDDVFSVAAPIAAGYFLGPAGFGMSSLGAGLTVGAAAYALTGDPMRALTSGLGAGGGSALGGKLGAYGATTPVAEVAGPGFGAKANIAASSVPGTTGASAFTQGASNLTAGPAFGAAPMGMANSFNMTTGAPLNAVANVADDALVAGAGQYSQNLVPNAGQGIKNFFGMGEAGKGPLDFFKTGPGEFTDAMTLGAPVLAGINSLNQPVMPRPITDTGYKMQYDGPYTPTQRDVRYPDMQEKLALGTGEYQYFNPVQPFPGYESAASRGYASGGPISFDAGGKVPVVGGISNAVPTVGEIPNLGEQANSFDSTGSYGIVDSVRQAEEVAYQNQIDELMKPRGVMESLASDATRGPIIGEYRDPATRFTSGVDSYATNPRSGLGGKGSRSTFTIPGLTRAQAISRLGPLAAYVPLPERPQYKREYMGDRSRATAADVTGAERNQFRGMGMEEAIPKAAGGGLLDFRMGGEASFDEPENDSDNPKGYALGGGIHSLRTGGRPATGGYLDGMGDGMSDSIPATIEGKQKARLADGEFVIPADVVSHVGNGSTKAGAKRFYKMLADVRKARTGSKKQGKQINPDKYMLA